MTTTNFRGEVVNPATWQAPPVVRTIPLRTIDGEYLGTITEYAPGTFRHSIQRFGTPDFATIVDAQLNFAETEKSIPEHVHAYLFAHLAI